MCRQGTVVGLVLLMVVFRPLRESAVRAAKGSDAAGGGSGGGGGGGGTVGGLRIKLAYEKTTANHLNDAMRDLLRDAVRRGRSPMDRFPAGRARSSFVRDSGKHKGGKSSADFVEQRGLQQDVEYLPGSLPVLLTSRHYGSAYTMDLYMGNPPQLRSLLIDTGSALMWTFCGDATNVSTEAPNNAFSVKNSSTDRILECSDPSCTQLMEEKSAECNEGACLYGQEYGDGSITVGLVIEETVTLGISNGSLMPVTMSPIGCGVIQKGLVLNMSADGIVGLGRTKYALNAVLSRMLGVPNIVTTCLNGEKGGLLSLGASPVTDMAISYTPILQSPVTGSSTHYIIGIEKWVVEGGHEIPVFSQALVDTGAASTRLSPVSYIMLERKIAARTGLAKDDLMWSKGFSCYIAMGMATNCSASIFPSFELTFGGGMVLKVPPEAYVMSFQEDFDCIMCLSILPIDPKYDFIIIGANFMQQSLVVHDNDNNRMGWMNVNCSEFQPSDYPKP